MTTTCDESAAVPGRARSPELDDAFSTLLELPDDLLSAGTRGHLADAHARLAEGRCNLVVLGEFKRGKSTLVNALLGRPLLPTGVLPLTSVVTVVRAGQPDRLVVTFADGRSETRAVSELAGYATEAGNPGNELGVELTTVETASTVLESGIQLVDTPGVGSVHTHNTDAAHAFVARTDAAIIVLSADQALSAQERELLAAVDRIAGRVVVVLNRIDLLDVGDRASAVRFVERAVASTAAGGPAVMPVSAREGTGIETLRAWIDRLPRTDNGRWVASERAARRALARAAGEARTAVNVELAALGLPLEELAKQAAVFTRRVESLAPAREAASAVLERGVATLLRERATQPLRVLAVESSQQLRVELRQEAERSVGRNGRELRAGLTAWVDDAVHRLIDETAVRIERDITSGLTDLVARHGAHVDEILAELADGVAEAFGERPSWVAPAIDVGERTQLRYKLRDEEEALGAALSAMRAAVPGALGRRLVRREQEGRLHSMVDRHAGRLREQIAQRTMDAGRDYDTQLRCVVDEAAEGVETRIARARAEVEQGAKRVSVRRAALRQAAAVCAAVAETARAGQQLP